MLRINRSKICPLTNYFIRAKPERKHIQTIYPSDPAASTQSNVSNPVGTDMKKDIFSNVYVKVGQVDTIPEPKATATFDEVPGPVSLKRLARFWTFVPIVGTQVTASTIQYLLSAGKLFGSQLSWGNNLWLFRRLLDEYGPVVRLVGVLLSLVDLNMLVLFSRTKDLILFNQL